MKPIPPIEIIVPFWGPVHQTCLLSMLLPSLLSPNNLPSWPYCDRTTLVLYTYPADLEVVKYAPELHQISQLMAVEYRPIPESEPIDPESPTRKYTILTDIHRDAIHRAHHTQAALIIPVADLIFSDGTFTTLAQSIESGAELVMLLGLLIDAHEIEHIHELYYKNRVLSLTHKQAITFYRNHMNALAWSRFSQSEYFSIWPYYLGERQQDNLWLRAFHLHPFFIRHPKPLRPQVLKFNTIDGDYLQQYYNQKDQIHIITDSQMVCLSLTGSIPLSACGDILTQFEKQGQALTFAIDNCAPIHRWFFQHLIGLQSTNPQLPQDSLIEQVYAELKDLIQFEDWWYKRDYQAIMAYYHQTGLQRPDAIGAYLCYYMLQAFCHQHEVSTALEMAHTHGETLRHFRPCPGSPPPLFHTYSGQTEQIWLDEAPLSLTDLQPGPFIFLWGDALPQHPMDVHIQWLILLSGNSIPAWLEDHATEQPDQPLIVLEQSLDNATLMLLLHRAQQVYFSASDNPFQADGLIYRVLLGKTCLF